MDQQFASLADHLTTIEAHFSFVLGYDSVTSAHFEVRRDGTHRLWLTASDDFQREIASAHQCRHGFQHFYFTDMAELWAQLRKLPGREIRELTVLARISGSIAEARADLISAAGRDFAQRLLAERDTLARLLPQT